MESNVEEAKDRSVNEPCFSLVEELCREMPDMELEIQNELRKVKERAEKDKGKAKSRHGEEQHKPNEKKECKQDSDKSSEMRNTSDKITDKSSAKRETSDKRNDKSSVNPETNDKISDRREIKERSDKSSDKRETSDKRSDKSDKRSSTKNSEEHAKRSDDSGKRKDRNVELSVEEKHHSKSKTEKEITEIKREKRRKSEETDEPKVSEKKEKSNPEKKEMDAMKEKRNELMMKLEVKLNKCSLPQSSNDEHKSKEKDKSPKRERKTSEKTARKEMEKTETVKDKENKLAKTLEQTKEKDKKHDKEHTFEKNEKHKNKKESANQEKVKESVQEHEEYSEESKKVDKKEAEEEKTLEKEKIKELEKEKQEIKKLEEERTQHFEKEDTKELGLEKTKELKQEISKELQTEITENLVRENNKETIKEEKTKQSNKSKHKTTERNNGNNEEETKESTTMKNKTEKDKIELKNEKCKSTESGERIYETKEQHENAAIEEKNSMSEQQESQPENVRDEQTISKGSEPNLSIKIELNKINTKILEIDSAQKVENQKTSQGIANSVDGASDCTITKNTSPMDKLTKSSTKRVLPADMDAPKSPMAKNRKFDFKVEERKSIIEIVLSSETKTGTSPTKCQELKTTKEDNEKIPMDCVNKEETEVTVSENEENSLENPNNEREQIKSENEESTLTHKDLVEKDLKPELAETQRVHDSEDFADVNSSAVSNPQTQDEPIKCSILSNSQNDINKAYSQDPSELQKTDLTEATTAKEPDSELPLMLTPSEESLDIKYRRTCQPFLQHVPCFKLKMSENSNIAKCRECRRRKAATQTASDVYCRFYEFRRLQYSEDGCLSVSGFPNPYLDPTREDLNIWEPDEHTEPTAGYMDIQVCRYILLHVADQFCYLWRQEVEALVLHENPDDTIAWKKVVQGTREICDVCDTTLFNFHWTCSSCGFGVCIDCFKDRKEKRTCRKTREKTQRGRDEYHWLHCSGSTQHPEKHELKNLMLTQIIAGDSLNKLGRLMHFVRMIWKIPQLCGCLLSREKHNIPGAEELIDDMIKQSRLQEQTSASSLATEETKRQQQRLEKIHEKKLLYARSLGIDYVPGRKWTKETLGKDPITHAFDDLKHINFLRPGLAGLRRFLPPRVLMLINTTVEAPGVPHEVLCNGKLLMLTNPINPDNRLLFQDVWKSGQPVMITNVARSLNLELWRPEAFCRDFGDKPNDLINCLNGNLVPNQPMSHFWEGFQSMHKRLLDHNGKPMLLKLKDWPPGDDFAEILPTRYADLMRGLPMPEYTLRTGNLNLASCLPKMFVPPDLGPKMYNAYGSALHPDKGTTNLHLDISDAVNIMVYVGIPEDSDSTAQITAANRAIAMGGCDYLTRARLYASEENPVPGAIWHIFAAHDTDKIRDLLNRVTLERGYRLEPDHDPIHDQNWYLDDNLRARLYEEYQVESYPIVQCLGDAVFIPAGAPHQVQNLHNCIKVAEDFVSPENITHCYHLTHEFRRLSSSHTNHEDKLQIKNIIYHAVKDCCTILERALDKRLQTELEDARERMAKRARRKRNKLNGDGDNAAQPSKKMLQEETGTVPDSQGTSSTVANGTQGIGTAAIPLIDQSSVTNLAAVA